MLTHRHSDKMLLRRWFLGSEGISQLNGIRNIIMKKKVIYIHNCILYKRENIGGLILCWTFFLKEVIALKGSIFI